MGKKIDKTLLQPVAGFRDFKPEEYIFIEKILSVMKKVSRLFGYEAYEGPMVEKRKLYEIKSGSDIVGEVFNVIDREGQELVLRPEMTPTLGRIIAEYNQKYPKPIRWFSIPRCFRDETPQKGRFKEFWQLNVDMVGENSVMADAEVIAVLVTILQELGLEKEDFVILINDRQFIQKVLETLGIGDKFVEVANILDKKDKVFQQNVEKILQEKHSLGSLDKALNENKKLPPFD